MIRTFFLLFFLLFFSFNLLADSPYGNYLNGVEMECPPDKDEFFASSQIGQSACITFTLEKYDKKLNILYKKLYSKADSEERNHLRSMQRAWIQFRDKTCEFIHNYYKGVRFSSRFQERCLAVLTYRRVQELDQLGTRISLRKIK